MNNMRHKHSWYFLAYKHFTGFHDECDGELWICPKCGMLKHNRYGETYYKYRRFKDLKDKDRDYSHST